MKLKKIVSLMLAGVMAVSMLAGCSGKGTTGGDDDKGEVVNTSSLVTAVNNAQEKVNFTANSSLTSVVSKFASVYGTEALEDGADKLKSYVENSTGNEYDDKLVDWGKGATSDNVKDLDGEERTIIGVLSVGVDEAYNEDAARKVMTRNAAEEIKKLPETTFVSKDDADKNESLEATAQGDKYIDYTYTGELSDMVAVKSVTGETTYYAVYTVTQTCTVKTFGA